MARMVVLVQRHLWPHKIGTSMTRRLQISTFAALRSPPIESSSAASSSTGDVLRTSLLEKLRLRERKDSKTSFKMDQQKDVDKGAVSVDVLPTTFENLGLSSELMGAIDELKIFEPTEVQNMAIPAILKGQNVVLASHTGSGKTLAYLLPLVQALRMDEAESKTELKPNKPRAVVLCPTRELAEQVLQVAKSLSHHAKFRSAMLSGGTPRKIQTKALNATLDMVIGTPGRVLLHIEQGNLSFRDIKYVVLDEADTMFDQGFGPDLKRFLDPLRNRVSRGGGNFQTILVTATVTKAVQKLLDEEFPGIKHMFTSTLHKKVDTSRHYFVRVPGNQNKMESLLQVLEPALAKKSRVMVFCNTVQSARALDHYLNEADIPCVNYHGEVPADQRVENLEKFKNEQGKGRTPALIATDLAARGLDLVVDHVIMFDFPHNSIDYLHRSGRTARMGAKGKVTSLVSKRDMTLAGRLEMAMSKGESLDTVTATREKLMSTKRFLLKAKQREALERAAANGKVLDRPGTLTLAMQRIKAKRSMDDNYPRGGKINQPKKMSKAKTQTYKEKQKLRTKA